MQHPERSCGCSVSLSEDILSLANQEAFAMDIRRSLRHLILRISGTAGNARRDRSAGTDRAHAARGILVSALLLAAALNAGFATAAVYGSGGAQHPRTPRATDGRAITARADAARTCRMRNRPGVTLSPQTPWM